MKKLVVFFIFVVFLSSCTKVCMSSEDCGPRQFCVKDKKMDVFGSCYTLKGILIDEK
jgi:hypothetical protein